MYAPSLVEVLGSLPILNYEIIDDIFAIHCPKNHRFDYPELASILYHKGCYSSGIVAFESLDDDTYLWLIMSGRELLGTSLKYSITWRYVLNSFLIKDFWDYD